MARTFRNEDLSGARFEMCTLQGARLRNVDMRGASLRGAWLVGVEISGLVDGLTVNGVDVGPLVEAELDRRHPERAALRFTDRAGAADAWSAVGGAWADTLASARRLPEARLHERVDDEWSLLETLRHLVFVVDAWISRPVLGATDPYWRAGVPHDEIDIDLPFDATADPDLDEVVAVWTERWDVVRGVIDAAGPEDLDRVCEQNPAPGYPRDTCVPVRLCLFAALSEAWEHRQFAERDLTVLEERSERDA